MVGEYDIGAEVQGIDLAPLAVATDPLKATTGAGICLLRVQALEGAAIFGTGKADILRGDRDGSSVHPGGYEWRAMPGSEADPAEEGHVYVRAAGSKARVRVEVECR